ncbi:zinc transporter ZupT, partial [Elusimicrobiota bacterium]
MESGNLLFAFGLTLFAGLSTGIGSAIAFFAKRTNTKLLAVSLGFSAGVMIYISMTELLGEAGHYLGEAFGPRAGAAAAAGAFFGGIILTAVIDKFVPSFENPHEARPVEEMGDPPGKGVDRALLRMGMFSAFA